MLGVHAFVDETKAKGLVVAAAIMDPAALPAARKVLNGLRAGGQSRIHFAKESDRRRRSICSAISDLGVSVHVYDAKAIKDQKVGRDLSLSLMVEDLVALSVSRLILEQDDSLLQADRRTLYQAVSRCGAQASMSYQHLKAKDEPMLWVPDAVAWCLARGQEWPARVESMIATRRNVS